MNGKQDERFVLACEAIAEGLKGIHEELRKAGNRYWPEPKPQRESIVSRIPNEEDKAKESLGLDGKPLTAWLTLEDEDDEDDGAIGERTKQWLRDHPKEAPEVPDARPEVAARGKSRNSGTKTAKG